MRRFIATICLIFTGTCTAFASGFSIYEASVRANGMLGAFAAYANHASTIFYNPAGLAGLKGVQISGGATVISPRSSFRNFTPLAPYGKKYNMRDQNFLVPNFYGTYEISDGFTAGVGVYAPFGLGTKWDSDWVGRGASTQADIKTLFVNPAIGYTLPDLGIGNIKVGAGLMVAFYGKVKLARAVQNFTPEGSFYLEGDLKKPAFGFNAGLLYSPVDEITFGFNYKSKVKTEYKGDAQFNNLSVGFPPTAKGHTTITLPSSFTAALNVKPVNNLQAEIDYVWWGWSSYDKLVINFDQSIPALVTPETPQGKAIINPRNYNNSWQLRFGLEYTQFGVKGLTARGGIAFDKNPIPEKDVDPTLPDSDRWLFSLGASYDITPQLAVDAAYIFIRANEREVQGTQSGIDGVYNTYANLPSLGITLKL